MKEQLSLALIEAALLVREELLDPHSKLQRSEKHFSVLFDFQLVHWVTVALEVAELCSKVLDWTVPTKNEPQLQGT